MTCSTVATCRAGSGPPGDRGLTVRESMIFLDGREFTGEPPGLRTVQRGQLMLVYLTDSRGASPIRIRSEVALRDRCRRSA